MSIEDTIKLCERTGCMAGEDVLGRKFCQIVKPEERIEFDCEYLGMTQVYNIPNEKLLGTDGKTSYKKYFCSCLRENDNKSIKV